jgi:hypothetical protein
MTYFPTVRDGRRARAVSADVPCGRVGTGTILHRQARQRLNDMSPRGGPTPDKPDVELVPYGATGLVEGRLAERAPAGRKAGRADGR